MGIMKPALFVSLLFMLSSCTQETQNKIGRSIQNWTGANGILEIYGEKLVNGSSKWINHHGNRDG